jgi:alpha-beta hydrolase superfamily lysophospholipase
LFQEDRWNLKKVPSKGPVGLSFITLGLDTKGISRDMEVVKAYEADPLVHGKTTVRWGTEIL